MRNLTGFSLLAAALLSPVALGQSTNLDSIRVPASGESEVNVTYKGGKGLNFKGENFDVWLRAYGAVDAIYTNMDNGAQDTLTFNHPFVRVLLKGKLFDDKTKFKLQWDPYNDGGATKNGTLKDFLLWRELFSNDNMSVSLRAGQGKTYYGREHMTSAGAQSFARRSLATRHFSNSRSAGGLLWVKAMEGKMNAWLGAFNTEAAAASALSAEEGANGDNELDWTAGVRYDFNGPMTYDQGDLARREQWNASLGGGIWIGNRDTGNGGALDNEVFAWNVNGAYKNQGIAVQFDVYAHNSEIDGSGGTSENFGWTVQGSYIMPENWGFGARISAISSDPNATTAASNILTFTGLGTAKGDVFEYSVNATRYFNGHSNKVQAELTIQDIDFDAAGATDATNMIIAMRWVLGM